MEKALKIEISHRSIIFTLLLLGLLWVLAAVKDVLFAFFGALIFVGAVNPTVEALQKKLHFPRWLAVFVLYLVILLLLAGVIAGLMPSVIQQTRLLLKSLPSWSHQDAFLKVIPAQIVIERLNQEIANLSGNLLRFTLTFFSNILGIFWILVVSFYLLLEHEKLDIYLFYLFGPKGQEKGKRIITKLEERLGGWVRAEAILMSVVACLSYVGYLALGLDFALPLAILAGLLEVVPNIGPVLAAVPAVLFGLTISPLTALAVAAWCFIVQQLENNLIVPKVINKTTGVNPVITLLALAIGLRLAGIVGMVLAIPVYLAVEVLIKELLAGKDQAPYKGE